MLNDKLEENDVQITHVEGDTDLLICQVTVDSASKWQTTLIGADMDLLVLLCFHGKAEFFNLQLRSEKKGHEEAENLEHFALHTCFYWV